MDPERRPDLRVGDAEREQALERLRTAHAEGRLDVAEFYARMDDACTARTFGQLDALVADLPAAGLERFPVPPRPMSAPRLVSTAPVAAPSSSGGFLASMPAALRGSWLTWATAVLINLVIWTMVSLGDGWTYFWPGWVAGPWGVVNLGMTAAWYFNRGRNDGRPEIGPG